MPINLADFEKMVTNVKTTISAVQKVALFEDSDKADVTTFGVPNKDLANSVFAIGGKITPSVVHAGTNAYNFTAAYKRIIRCLSEERIDYYLLSNVEYKELASLIDLERTDILKLNEMGKR